MRAGIDGSIMDSAKRHLKEESMPKIINKVMYKLHVTGKFPVAWKRSLLNMTQKYKWE
jgi:hypothetical protein